jgi:hypothetical protein
MNISPLSSLDAGQLIATGTATVAGCPKIVIYQNRKRTTTKINVRNVLSANYRLHDPKEYQALLISY